MDIQKNHRKEVTVWSCTKCPTHTIRHFCAFNVKGIAVNLLSYELSLSEAVFRGPFLGSYISKNIYSVATAHTYVVPQITAPYRK
uniref:Ovule protein n=1 Tax=Steinernema glaseri TaxID=37863 RepID=A0A1I8ALA7_9BILA